ncbi:hypothetical protein [Methylobacterium durans]|uniref:Uncharacterized protein n=1 Tax=Methylobacterium durans TaxID=2202825 RepID=A0A2U8W3E8_9HYPH|nr:hypothetical protein [Methylobacterium durans]AWN40604.1 hypothetical protein DK389_08750 [Methylobacterium durans]
MGARPLDQSFSECGQTLDDQAQQVGKAQEEAADALEKLVTAKTRRRVILLLVRHDAMVIRAKHDRERIVLPPCHMVSLQAPHIVVATYGTAWRGRAKAFQASLLTALAREFVRPHDDGSFYTGRR